MKKILMAATAALALAGNPVIAQEVAGGQDSSDSAFGNVSTGTIAAGVAGLAIAAAIVSNNRGSSSTDGGGDPDPTCNGDDALVDGVCVGTTTTVTVTGTGSMTSTATVPVTFTYAPTI
jgi:hypothetical protein